MNLHHTWAFQSHQVVVEKKNTGSLIIKLGCLKMLNHILDGVEVAHLMENVNPRTTI